MADAVAFETSGIGIVGAAGEGIDFRSVAVLGEMSRTVAPEAHYEAGHD